MKAPPALDHLIHLVPPGELSGAVSQWTQLGFTVLIGGSHADGLTRNALVVLPDGVYIELIEFIPERERAGDEDLVSWKTRRQNHWWAERPVGWIDWCLLGGASDGRAAEVTAALRADLGSATDSARRESSEGSSSSSVLATSPFGSSPIGHGMKRDATAKGAALAMQTGRLDASTQALDVVYDQPRSGGRTTTEGKQIQWKVTFPLFGAAASGTSDSPGSPAEVQEVTPTLPRGAVPFWCEDLTPRDWRAPPSSPSHPNGARGLSGLTLLYHPDAIAPVLRALAHLFGHPAQEPSRTHPAIGVDARDFFVPTPRSSLPDDVPSPVALEASAPASALPFLAPSLLRDHGLVPIHVRAASDPNEIAWVEAHGGGLYEVEITVSPDKLPGTAPPDGVERSTAASGYGRLRLHPAPLSS